jgi:CheY-like chemotaxis protein
MSISILCVDDDPNILEGYRRLLSRRYDVYLACGPQQGLEKLDLGPNYSVIISDKHMPGMDGVAFLKRVSQRFPASVRVMLTGDADQSSAIEALNQGIIQRFLAKPCPSQLLAQVVDEAVGRCRQQQQSVELRQVRRAAASMLAQSLQLARPGMADLGLRALARAQGLARERGMDLPEAAEVALRLTGLAAMANGAEAGAALLAGMPGWDEAAELFLQAQGLRPASLLGSLMKLALDLELAVELKGSQEAALDFVRPLHRDSPWLGAMDHGPAAAESLTVGMACAA